MTLFPGALPAAGAANPGDTLAVAGHTSLHNTGANESRALGTKVGTGASTATSGTVLRGTGAGTSSWGAVSLSTDITGILPIGNGGIGQATLSGLALPNPTITGTVPGAATYTNPTLTTPVIADFTNATHGHTNAAGGGTLAPAAMPALDLSIQTISNPYKFRVYQTGATNTGNGGFATIAFDTEDYDTNNNVSSGTYTAPVTGFYFFSFGVQATTTGSQTIFASLVVNGVEVARGGRVVATSAVIGSTGSVIASVTAGQTVIVQAYGDTARPLDVGTPTANNYFSGFLVSRT